MPPGERQKLEPQSLEARINFAAHNQDYEGTPAYRAWRREFTEPGKGRLMQDNPSLPIWNGDNLHQESYWNASLGRPNNNSGLMLAMANSPAVNKMKNIYNQVDPFFPNVDPGDQQIGYDFDKNLWGGTLGFGGGYGTEDDAYNAYINWGTNW